MDVDQNSLSLLPATDAARFRQLKTVANAHGLFVEVIAATREDELPTGQRSISIIWLYGSEDSVELRRFYPCNWDRTLDDFELWLDGFTAGKEIG
jgi:hypothetical protein